MMSNTKPTRLLDSAFAAQRAEILRALGNPVRLRIVACLCATGERTVGDVARLLTEQTDGRIAPSDIWPVGCIHPLCSGSTFLVGEGDDYEPFTRGLEEGAYRSNFDDTSPQGSVFLDVVAEMSPSGELPQGLPILIMEYMDAWTMDLERARECNLAVAVMDGTSIPFCVYHLTDIHGKRLYPHGGRR